VLSISQFLSALSTKNKADGKTGVGGAQKETGRIRRIVPMGPERLIIQSSVDSTMFAVDVKSSRVQQIAHPFGASYWTGWVWRDGSSSRAEDGDGDGMIVCTDVGVMAFNLRTGAVRRLCGPPELSVGDSGFPGVNCIPRHSVVQRSMQMTRVAAEFS
jgi:hypothetical protein